MSGADTIIGLLVRGEDAAPAILAPGRSSLSYAGLRSLVESTVGALNRLGVGRNDPVAIVLPSGPELASAFVAIAAGATTAPLNPAYRAEEFAFYLSDLEPRLVVVQEGMATPAQRVAQERGIPVAALRIDPSGPAGVFELTGTAEAVKAGRLPASDDVALLLHTSGTLARPKLVPLTQRNICASAETIAASLALNPADRCLNVMPLFHVHGLMAAVLASLAAGASVACAPGFDALRFFAQMKECEPTWYTAVPAMHQAILARAVRNKEIISERRLRLIRSASAALPPRVMAALEATFGAPVIEAYGMTEAAHQMATNPLPPRSRRPGSVGLATGCEIAVMDGAGALLPAGATGEIVIRGRNVTPGYRNNPEANAAAFTNGWFRTGDEGTLDAEGYLRLTGRLKEIINRGGEKISPREVEEVLLDHPGVAQAVTFAVPDGRLGEDVAAAVVLKEGAGVTERELREFAGQRLAAMKVPRQILFLDEIPTGATGKLQRIGLARMLGLG